MTETAKTQQPFTWAAPLVAVVVVTALFLVVELSDYFDLDIFLFPVVAAVLAFAFIICAVCKVRGDRRPWIVALGATLILSCILIRYAFEVRVTGLWLMSSSREKATILSRPAPADGLLKHDMWYDSGFAGTNNFVYLVFDPNDEIRNELKRQDSKHFYGLPCSVWRVHRLERNWYAVRFYTDTFWEDCAAT